MPLHSITAATNDASIESTAASWAGALAGTGTLTLRAVHHQFAPVGVGHEITEQFEDISADYGVGALFLAFDTSAVGPHDTIVDVGFEILAAARFYGADDFTFELYAYDWGEAVDAGDWLTPEDLAGMTLLASLPASAYTANGDYHPFTPTDALKTAIVRGGVTRLVLVTSDHRQAVEPTGGDWYIMTWATGNAGNPPRLTVETLAAGMSDDAVESLTAAHSDKARLILITIDHPEFLEPIRATSDGVATVSNGETFVTYPFEFVMHPDGPDEIGRARIRISNVGREILESVRSVQGGSIEVTAAVVLHSDPDTYQLGPLVFECEKVPWDAMWIDGVLGGDSWMHDAWPYVQFTPGTTPGIFL